jgi:DNA-binding NtrC family response regulator
LGGSKSKDRKRILIVDDDAMVRFIFQETLTWLRGDYEVVATHSALDALAQVRKRSFELIITDLWMPEMGGVELTEAVRDLDRGAAIVWITGCDSTNTHEEALRLGIQGCYDKPLQVTEIRNIVQQALMTTPDHELYENNSSPLFGPY